MSAINVSHGGHSGDIVYSLPFMDVCRQGQDVNFFIANDKYSDFPDGMSHPNGRVMMTQASFDFIKPLLLSLPYVKSVSFVPTKEIPPSFALDFYRDIAMNKGAGNIVDWARKFYGIPTRSHIDWLVVPPVAAQDIVVCAFTRRYRNTMIDYNFLNEVENLLFLGLDDEYEHFRARYKLENLQHAKVKDALEMATIIKSSKFFLGNQSFAFALAEAMKVNRALEVCETVPNVVPSGRGAHDYMNNQSLRMILINNEIVKNKNVENLFDAEYVLYLS